MTPTGTGTDAPLSPTPPRDRPNAVDTALRWAPLVIAVAFYLAFATVVLTRPERMIEPDPYAYRASIVALGEGNLTLSPEQYTALTERLQQTTLGGGIMQWHQRADGQWVSEKNPGYPFLAVGFDQVKAIRLAPLFYGLLAAIGLWLGGRRWTRRRPGRWAADWGGTFAVGAFFSCALAMVMAWRSTMPTFTDAALVACGLGLLVWSALSFDRSHRARTIVGALAFLAFGLAFLVRYTNIVVLAVAGLAALVICIRKRWGLGWRTLVWWALAALPPVIAALVYNAVVFDGPLSTGYNARDVQFSTSAIPDNLSIMPKRLLQAMPIWVLGVSAIAILVAVLVTDAIAMRRARVPNATDDRTSAAPVGSAIATGQPTRAAIDLWTGALLVATWGALWAVYSAYQWTANMGGGPGGMGGGPRGAFSQPVYSTVRFYLPALGAIALLVAWLLGRLPAVIGLVVLVALFAFGAHEFVDTTNSSWARMTFGGGAGGGPGGQGPGGFSGLPGGATPDGGPGGFAPPN